MKLNHDIYREAMDSISLSDERGRKLLEKAVCRSEKSRRKHKFQIAAAMAAMVVLCLSLNGICYAQTGKNVWEMFMVIFENGNVKDMAALVDGARESGESITYGNLKFTLEYYWYDKENMEAFLAVRTESRDGTALDLEQIEMEYCVIQKVQIGSITGYGKEVSEDQTSFQEYYHIGCNYDEFGKPVDKIEISVYSFDEDRAVGSFELEPTGVMKARYVDVSILEDCSTKARMTGAGLKIIFEKAWQEEKEPFGTLDVVMKDGTIYRSGFHPGSQTIPIYNAKGEILNSEELKTLPDPEKIHECSDEWYTPVLSNKETIGIYQVCFKDYIDVDDVEAVYMDGIKLPLE